MKPTPPVPPSAQPPKAVKMLDLTPRTAKVPVPRIVYYAVEGFGKTTFASFSPNPIILAARDEKGVQRLLDAGQINPVPMIDVATWPDLLEALDALATHQHDRKTIILDSLGAYERLCHEEVTRRDFRGDPGDGGFLGFARGPKVALTEWTRLLQKLDVLNQKGMMIILLGHSYVEKFKNPTGSDFDRFACKLDPLAWSMIKGWADCVWFGNFLTVTSANKNPTAKAKGIGGTDRVVYTQRRDSHDAKPGYNMPAEIFLGEDPAMVWNELTDHIFQQRSQ